MNDCSFDLCTDSGAADAFFPGSRRAMVGTYQEVPCSQWSGSDGQVLWNGACLAGETAPLWPAAGGCPNTGANRSLVCTVMQLLIDVHSRHPTRLNGSSRTRNMGEKDCSMAQKGNQSSVMRML